jgi:hypothetical protein
MGQISFPGAGGIKTAPTNRQVGPAAGAGTSGNNDLYLGGGSASNLTASDAVVLGANALNGGLNLGTNQGSGFVVIGSGAGAALTTANTPSVIIGHGAYATAGDAENDILIGDQIFGSTPFVGNTVAIGQGLGQHITNVAAQQFNVLLGDFLANSGGGGTGGGQLQNCVVIGYAAINKFDNAGAFTWNGDVLIGSNVCGGTTLQVNNSVYIGSAAGASHLGQPNLNTIIGTSAGGSGTDVSHCTVLGASSSSGTGNNVILGDTINSGNMATLARSILIGSGAGSNDLPAAQNDVFLVETVIAATQRALIYGNLTTGNVVLGRSTTAAGRNFGTGALGALKLLNGTVPSTAPDGGGELFSIAGLPVWVDTTGVSHNLVGAGGGLPLFFGAQNLTAPPAIGTWTWSRNQDAAVVTSRAGGAYFDIAYPPQGALAGANWPGNFGQPLASATFTLTACIAAAVGNAGTDPWAGIYWRDSVAQKFQLFIIDMRTVPWSFSSYRFDETVNNVVSTYFGTITPFHSNPGVWSPIWLRAQRVAGGNVTLSLSYDGVNFNALAAADATNFVPSPNEVGISVVNDAGAGTGATNTNYTTLYSWVVGP